MVKPVASRILLVEGNAKARNLRTIMLGTHGYDVEAVANVAELNPAWREAAYDLVLLSLGTSGSAADMVRWRRVQRDHPAQQFLFILSVPERLCPLYFEGEQVREEEISDAFLGRVQAALGVPLET